MLYDKDIREPLFEFLEERYGKVRILEEKQMGRSRADAVMVMEDALVGIEIKSDADTYARLTTVFLTTILWWQGLPTEVILRSMCQSGGGSSPWSSGAARWTSMC